MASRRSDLWLPFFFFLLSGLHPHVSTQGHFVREKAACTPLPPPSFRAAYALHQESKVLEVGLTCREKVCFFSTPTFFFFFCDKDGLLRSFSAIAGATYPPCLYSSQVRTLAYEELSGPSLGFVSPEDPRDSLIDSTARIAGFAMVVLICSASIRCTLQGNRTQRIFPSFS